MRGDIWKLDPKMRLNPCKRSKARFWGYQFVAAVRLDEGVAISLLFRHSIMGVVE
jgi:hypothetical protein